MRKLKPISRILFERQTADFRGETIQCYNLFECLLFLAVAVGFFGGLVAVIAFAVDYSESL